MVDTSHLTSEQEKYERTIKHRPHVVILGAGATVAAIPFGDKNGKVTSCMDGFIDKLGLTKIIEDLSLDCQSSNLEDLFSEIDEKSKYDNKYKEVKNTLEKYIFDYFASLELPESPTVYDFLLLSLRPKDLIASFNWDPLIIQAGFRILAKNSAIKLPPIVFLHGNVALYLELPTKKIRYWPRGQLNDNRYLKSQLLYPIKHKDYQINSAIRESWEMLTRYLKYAYIVTIFGYSAPKSDTAAIKMLKKAWGNVEQRNLEEIEVIDIKSKDDSFKSWKSFIHTHHFSYSNNFFDSTLGRFPRRTTEELFDASMNCLWRNDERGFKRDMSLDNALLKIRPLLLDEALKNDGKDEMLDNPYNESFKFD